MSVSFAALKSNKREHHYECIPPAGRVPGNKAIWVAILSEMTEFALMFVVYFLAKAFSGQGA